MRAVVQRVSSASVEVDEEIVGQINDGLVILLGIGESDGVEDVEYLIDKIINLRIFEDTNEKMNLSLMDLEYELLVVSQFTLYGDCRKGRRPNFMEAAKSEKAQELYNIFLTKCKNFEIKVQAGIFQAYMKVKLINDGPVTIILDSKKSF